MRILAGSRQDRTTPPEHFTQEANILSAVKNANLALAFLLELAVLYSVGLWGFSLHGRSLRWLAGLGGPLLFIVLWSMFGAPGATMALHGGVRLAFDIVWFGLGALALYAAGRAVPAIVFIVLYVINTVLVRVWHQSS